MRYIKTFEELQNKGYWVFEPKEGIKAATSKFPTEYYNKEEAIELFSSEKDITKFKPVYFEPKELTKISFKEDESENDFIKWLRKEKSFTGNEDDLQYEYSATELDYLYNEFVEKSE